MSRNGFSTLLSCGVEFMRRSTSSIVQALHKWPESFFIENGAFCVPLPQRHPSLLQTGHLKDRRTTLLLLFLPLVLYIFVLFNLSYCCLTANLMEIVPVFIFFQSENIVEMYMIPKNIQR